MSTVFTHSSSSVEIIGARGAATLTSFFVSSPAVVDGGGGGSDGGAKPISVAFRLATFTALDGPFAFAAAVASIRSSFRAAIVLPASLSTSWATSSCEAKSAPDASMASTSSCTEPRRCDASRVSARCTA